MKTYRGIEIPELNGRPQLWLRGVDWNTGVRIIYPNGKVEYSFHGDPFKKGCTSSSSQLSAIKKCIKYDMDNWQNRFVSLPPIFVGYL